jgi:hypothetical protein
MAHPNEELVRSWLGALARGDLEAARDTFTDDVILHFPGQNPLAGDHQGRAQVLRLIRRATEIIGGSFQIHDVLANDARAVTLANLRIERDKRIRTCRRITVYDIKDGKISEFWITYSDQDLIDEVASVYESGA